MSYVDERFEHAGYTIEIVHDDDSYMFNPRTDDNLGTIYMAKSRDWIKPDGDTDDGLPYAENGYVWDYAWFDFDAYTRRGKRDLMAQKIAVHRNLGTVLIPLQFGYDGGLTEADDNDADGYIYILPEKVFDEFPKKIVKRASVGGPNGYVRGVYERYKRISPKLRARVEESLRGEITTYNQWASGDMWGYRMFDAKGEEVDSCWGFYGTEHVIEEAKWQAQAFREGAESRRAERLAAHAAIEAATGAYWGQVFA